jgi:hypothetical protein
MAWYVGEATIEQGDLKVVVQCRIDFFRSVVRAGAETVEGLGSWNGAWSDPDPQFTLRPDESTIRLADGRSGSILITAVEHRNDREMGTFVGNGGLPA